MVNNQMLHKSVLLEEVMGYLEAGKQGFYIDATFGAGGYSKRILDANPNNNLLAIDRDKQAVKIACQFKKQYKQRFNFANNRFSQLDDIVKQYNINDISAIVFDLGVSSMQLDRPERGFSFAKEAKLDMRMGDNELSAYEIVNFSSEEELSDIIFQYGEERYARKISRFIVEERKLNNINTTTHLADIITRAKPKIYGKVKIHPATKTFQAIRIEVNQELEELKKALNISKQILTKGGKLILVSFHGLEDRIVKNFIRENSQTSQPKNRYLPDQSQCKDKYFEILNKKIIKASDEEINNNPRARSAILRAVKKI